MYEFNELSGSDVVTTFAYWLLAERKRLPDAEFSLDNLQGWMSYHYDVEEQAYTQNMLKTNKRLLKHLQPVSPVTLAERWTPFSLCKQILGDPLHHERGEGSYSPAMAVWNPKFLGACEPEDRSEHPRHFTFLLRLACSMAEDFGGRVFLVGSPGWSYSSWKNDFYMMNPEAALLMHRAGYHYTDRIAQ
ncbi:MAG: hypothetical protein KDM63_08230 [Verrucomicrobiae bacterium]|nr:hypothetical protein [Verrucomicrobiae bacterium]